MQKTFINWKHLDNITATLFLHHHGMMMFPLLTHWGRVTHFCVSKLMSIASDNGLSAGPRQAIICNNVWILLIGSLEKTSVKS